MSAKLPSIKNINGDDISYSDLNFLFVLSNKNSGTSIQAQYIHHQLGIFTRSIKRDTFIANRFGEGWRLTKHLYKPKWDARHRVDYQKIKEIWTEKANGRIFVDASPPNIIRFKGLKEAFGNDSAAIITIVNPYQNIASRLRQGSLKIGPITDQWVARARRTRKLIRNNRHIPFIPYETFVSNPSVVNNYLKIPVEDWDDSTFTGKPRSLIKGINSGYVRSIGFLKPEEIDVISSMLGDRRGLLNFFSYDLRSRSILEESQAMNPAEFAVGVERRKQFDTR